MDAADAFPGHAVVYAGGERGVALNQVHAGRVVAQQVRGDAPDAGANVCARQQLALAVRQAGAGGRGRVCAGNATQSAVAAAAKLGGDVGQEAARLLLPRDEHA